MSTVDQHAANQLADLRSWAEARGLTVVREFMIEDTAWGSGNGKGRDFDAARAALLNGAQWGQYSVILIWAVDRLSRKGIEDTLGTVRRLAEAGCEVWSRQESWTTDLKNPHMRELFMAIAAWAAKMESDRRSERIKIGLARRKAEGKPIGRQKGATDVKRRRRSGYVARWERERTPTARDQRQMSANLAAMDEGS